VVCGTGFRGLGLWWLVFAVGGAVLWDVFRFWSYSSFFLFLSTTSSPTNTKTYTKSSETRGKKPLFASQFCLFCCDLFIPVLFPVSPFFFFQLSVELERGLLSLEGGKGNLRLRGAPVSCLSG